MKIQSHNSHNRPERMLSRRSFLRASAASLVVAALAGTRLWSNSAAAQSENPDIEILNYALALEHLESRFYEDINNIDMVTGQARQYFIDIGKQEAAHVVVLTGAIIKLGGTPIRAQAKYNLPTFQSEQEVLEFFLATEELGAAAYLGQAPRIQDKELLTTAISIHNVEGQHAALLNYLLRKEPSPVFAQAKSMAEVLATITPLFSSTPSTMPQAGRGGRDRGHDRVVSGKVIKYQPQ